MKHAPVVDRVDLDIHNAAVWRHISQYPFIAILSTSRGPRLAERGADRAYEPRRTTVRLSPTDQVRDAGRARHRVVWPTCV
jgi:hypothetical protein